MRNSDDILKNNMIAVMKDLLKYWHLIAACLVIAIISGSFYLKYSAKTYKASSSILLRIERAQNFGRGSDDILRAFDFMIQDKSFQNEIYFIQSLPLIKEVVDDMDLRVSYLMQQGGIPKRFTFSRQTLYRDSPFIVIPNEDHLQPINMEFHLKILDEEKFHLSAEAENVALMDLKSERTITHSDYSIDGTYRFGSQIDNNNSSFSIVLSSSFIPEEHLDKDLFFRINNLNQVAASFKGALSIDARGIESTMAELSFKSGNINIATTFLNKLIDAYIDANIEEANYMANRTIEHIDRQLVDVSDDLSLSEQQLQNLKSAQSVMNIEEKAQNVYNELHASRNLRDEAQRRLNYLQQLNDHFVQYKDSSAILAPSSLGLPDPLLNNLIQELTTLNSEKQRIISQDQLRNPRLQTIDISIETLKNAISDNLTFTISTTKREIDDLNAKINELNREFSELPSTQRELLGIERRFNLNDAIYTTLLERRIQAQIIKASKLPDAKVIEPPRYAGVAAPIPVLILFFSVFMGASIPSSFILLKKAIANRISNKEDIKQITAVPVIGSVSHNENHEQNVVKHYPRSPLTESFHILRSNLVYFLHGKSNKIILVTSSLPGEGKSFTAINLASSFAVSKNKTVLVEFDLRNPSKFPDVFNANELVGVSSHLINKATLDEIIIPSEIPNLDIIQSGQIPPNPIELISSSKTTEMLEELKKRYEYIILDTPPYGLVTDAFMLMHYSDIKLFVARLGYIKKKAFTLNIEDIEDKKIENLYIVLNDDKEDKLGYGKYAYMKKNGKSKGLFKKKIAVF